MESSECETVPERGDVRLADGQLGDRVQHASAVDHQEQDGGAAGGLHRHVPAHRMAMLTAQTSLSIQQRIKNMSM